MTKTHQFKPMTDRYEFDFGAFSYANGWLQVDTKQDASYFGTWTHPGERKIACYCEGDFDVTACADDAEYAQQVRELADWNKQGGRWLGIDIGLRDREAMQARFDALGLGDLTH